jgi:hypothetical protein
LTVRKYNTIIKWAYAINKIRKEDLLCHKEMEQDLQVIILEEVIRICKEGSQEQEQEQEQEQGVHVCVRNAIPVYLISGVYHVML